MILGVLFFLKIIQLIGVTRDSYATFHVIQAIETLFQLGC